ncbi:MAG TPA: hypothetical protein ENK46_09105 [Flavobacteriia bacterium]|nr:hypothetical protein [Flavobacteriia bacterium]
MKGKIVLLAMLFFLNIAHATDVIKLPKYFSVKSTFSGNLSDNESFHLIFTKDTRTKKFVVFPYFYNGISTEKFKQLVSDEPYSLVSFHYDNDIVSVFLSYKVRNDYFLKKISLYRLTKEVKQSEPFPHNDFLTSIRNKDKSIFIYKSKDRFLVRQFNKNEPNINSELDIQKTQNVIEIFFEDNKVVAVKTDEFVSNGPTSKIKVYYIDGKLVFTKVIRALNQTEILEVFLGNEKLTTSLRSFSMTTKDYYKKMASFVVDGTLFQLGVSKDRGSIKIWDYLNKKELNVIPIDGSLNSKIVKGNDFVDFSKFLKQSARRKHIPTITVNKASDNLFRLRVDYVDVTYSYNYNWWMFHQKMMMHQQMQMQQAMNSVPRFGPDDPGDITFDTYTIKNDNRFFEIVLDDKGRIVQERPQSIYGEINKKEYIEKLEELSDIKYESSCFLKIGFRYFGYSKSSKGFVIYTEKLK